MALPKQVTSWPIDGGLDTLRSPLAVQPGSHLQLDNVIQVRKNEWRRRNGFTQVAADTNSSYGAAPFLANLGPGGVAALASWQGGSGVYRPSLTSNRWSEAWAYDFPSDISRVPVIESNGTTIGFAAAGNMQMVVQVGTTAPCAMVVDAAGRAPVKIALGTYLRVRCAATSTHLVAFLADGSGNLYALVTDAATGVSTGPTVIKTGLHTTQPYLDAMWYGGSTITVAVRTSGDAVRFIEYNPSTGALATDTTLAAVSCASCLALIADPTGSGVRFVGTSHTTPTTRVIRCTSAGAITTNDQVEAIASTQITGCASAAGANWSVIYRTSTPNLRINYKTGGVVASAATMRGGNTDDLTIDSMGWGESGSGFWQCIIGLHSTNSADPQDSWVVMTFQLGYNGSILPTRHAPLVPLNASAALSLSASLFQVVQTGTRTFRFCLPVLAHYSNEAGTITRRYSLDVFTQVHLTNTEIGTLNVGWPAQYKDTALFPQNGVMFPDDGRVRSLGTAAPPRTPTLTQAAGGSLTLTGAYQYVVVVERLDGDGNIWSGPPSVPALITLTGGNQTVGVAASNWYVDDISALYDVVIFRTVAGGSKFWRLKSFRQQMDTDISFNDTVSDATLTLAGSELLYTTALPATEITPRMSHLALFGDRLWGVNADYRTEVWPSRNLRPGRQPEFTEATVIDIDDAFGDVTNLSSMDDKGVVFKKNAVYFVMGEGKKDDGSGEAHTWVQVSSDAGSLAGSPVVSTGDAVYFVSDRGIHAVDRAANLAFVGAPVDQYLHQPDVQAVETIFDACFVPLANEVRFVTTNYILVYNRTFGTWSRWTGLAGMKRCLVVGGVMWLFKSDGTVWKETVGQLTDQGTDFTGVIRSAWIRPAADGTTKATTSQDGLRLYRGRVVFTRTAGGSNATLIGKIYRSDDDAKVETFTSGAIAGATLSGKGEMHPVNQKCTSFSLALVLPSGDVTVRVEGFSAQWAPRSGQLATDGSSKWSAP